MGIQSAKFILWKTNLSSTNKKEKKKKKMGAGAFRLKVIHQSQLAIPIYHQFSVDLSKKNFFINNKNHKIREI